MLASAVQQLWITHEKKSESVSHSVISWLFATLWTVVRQAPLSMEFSRQEYWNRLPFPSPGDLLDPGIRPRFSALQVDSLYTPSLLSLPPTHGLRVENKAFPYRKESLLIRQALNVSFLGAETQCCPPESFTLFMNCRTFIFSWAHGCPNKDYISQVPLQLSADQ